VKRIVCLAMKGKDVILGLKYNTLLKRARKTKVIWDMSHLGKKQGELYLNKKCSHPKKIQHIFNIIINVFSISHCGHYGDLLSTILASNWKNLQWCKC
jgi:hypothetical protein